MVARFFALPALIALVILVMLTAFARPSLAVAKSPTTASAVPAARFMAQIVGVQWLNPLQRRDYPTEWQLLWTLGLVQPNKDDDMVKAKPEKYSKLNVVAAIAAGNGGKETFKGYHHKYVTELISMFHDVYFSSSRYFYNAHSLDDNTSRRELAGIHVEYALPGDRLDSAEAVTFTRETIIECFSIGNVNFPTAWTRNSPPDVRVTIGGPNAGFASLASALAYLQAHPSETAWAMNWDAPNFPPAGSQLNENMVLLVLAGPDFKTGREPLAWIGLPASRATTEFNARKDMPPVVQAWSATLAEAAANAAKKVADIGYVIHDANTAYPNSSARIRSLAHAIALDVPGLDFMAKTFNTPALLGEMGAGTALTNVALGIAYANHFGKDVLIAGTSDAARPIAVLVSPPATVRPIVPDGRWFRARGENHAYLMWWGLRHDAPKHVQGFSE